jgi:putative NADPH-quinone reductase
MDVLVVHAHPQQGSYTHAVADAAVRGFEGAGHHVTLLDLYASGFVPAMSAAERAAYHGEQPLIDPQTAEHAALVQRAGVLVFVYPTWWSGPPAILKGWLERVMVPGVAFRFDARGRVRPALTNVRRIVGISTYGSPWTYVKLLQDGGRRMLTRGLRLNCGVRTPTTWLGLYSVDTLGDTERAAFLDRVEHTMAHLEPVRA